jgi:hypothetical protein
MQVTEKARALSMRPVRRRTAISILLLAAAAAFSGPGIGARAETLTAADPTLQGDGTMSAAAARALSRGPLPFSDADIAAKAAANRSTARPAKGEEAGQAGDIQQPRMPIVQGGLSFAGRSGKNFSPPDTTGAIGNSSYIQLVNLRIGIFNRDTGALIASSSLNQLGQLDKSVNAFNPQIIWDGQTERYFYAMDAVFSSSDNKLAFGFSKTSSPTNATTDWCHYVVNYGARFPDYPKLGDSSFFAIIGVNAYDSSGQFVGSDLVAIRKPPAGTNCPKSIKFGTQLDLRDTSNARVFTPVPAQQVDDSNTGYIVSRNGVLPSTNLWIFDVRSDNSTGAPVFGAARKLPVKNYDIPPDATQPNAPQLLDTLDARNTQAVQATNPNRNKFSFWTQHTIANGSLSRVRWYEIDPVPSTPVQLRSSEILDGRSFYFNAAISPDRQRLGSTAAFGNSFVIEYNVSGSVSRLSPRIVVGSSANGGGVTYLPVLKIGSGPYVDRTCDNNPPGEGFVCRWGDYSSATPDPNPPSNRQRLNRGVVWGTNQFSGVANPPPNGVNWRTQIFSLQP